MIPGNILTGEQKVFIRFHKINFQIVNSCNNQVIIWLYCLESKRTTTDSAEDDARAGDDQLGTTHNHREPTYSPISTHRILSNHKVKVKRKKVLNPGEVFMMTHTRFCNYMFNTGRFAEGPPNATDFGVYRGITEQWLLRVQGTVAFKEDSTSNTNTGALLAPAKVDAVMYETISYKIPDLTQRATVTKVNDLTALSEGENVRVQQLDSGVPVDYSEG